MTYIEADFLIVTSSNLLKKHVACSVKYTGTTTGCTSRLLLRMIYFLSIFCMRLVIDLHLQVTNTESGYTATPARKLLYSTLRSLFSGLLSCSVQNSFRLDSCTLLNGEKLGLRQSLYFVYVWLL